MAGEAAPTSPNFDDVVFGADTAVWLAASAAGVESTGGLWLDQRPRWEHKVPWTRLSEADFIDVGARLWAWCAERTGWDGRQREA